MISIVSGSFSEDRSYVDVYSSPASPAIVPVTVFIDTKTTVTGVGVAVGVTITVTVPPSSSVGSSVLVGAGVAYTVIMPDMKDGTGCRTIVSEKNGGTIVNGSCTPNGPTVIVIVSMPVAAELVSMEP